ncbi:MAG: hypothetical protein Q27BPR15_14225 [Rhodobacter sp. CACIA14H1]|nr:MAG: hypothetical protein Q27BPR15_14225 [Rhodobacter sp. CACIA14H1]
MYFVDVFGLVKIYLQESLREPYLKPSTFFFLSRLINVHQMIIPMVVTTPKSSIRSILLVEACLVVVQSC